MYRMNKPRLNDGPLSRKVSIEDHSSDSESSSQRPIRACFEDLKRPENRQMLRRQLTGTFPETAPKLPQRPSNEVLIEKWSLKDRLSKKTLRLEVAEVEAHSSSSTVDSVGLNRLSAVPEKENNESIDIEKAISLLQELKKIASPSELVALHRALLPTKETEKVKSPASSPLDERSPPSPATRRRSVLPPGLATRGGADEDVLRKPNGARSPPAISKPAKQNDWYTHRPVKSQNNLAALDLADDCANPVTTRPTTPTNSFYGHTGAYQHGTLRVTNGAASPVPSIRPAPAVEAVRKEMRAEYKPSLHSRATIDVMSAKTSKDSRAVRNRIAILEKAGQFEAHPGSDVVKPTSQAADHAVHRPTPIASARTIERPAYYENDPRPQQNLCESDTSILPPKDTENESPGTERRTMLNLTSCMKAADDSDDHESHNTARNVAYARLNGNANKDIPTPSSARSSQEHFWSSSRVRSKKSQKIDSGYSSDISFQALQSGVSQNDSSVQATVAYEPSAKQEKLPMHAESPNPTADHPPSSQSKSPLTDDTTSPIPQTRHTEGLDSSSNNNHAARTSSEEVDTALPTIPTTNTANVTTTIREKLNSRSQKKLQKNMPPAVKYRRKLEAERKKQAKIAEQFNQPLPTSNIALSAEDIQKAAEMLGDYESAPDVTPEQQTEAPGRRSGSQNRDKKRSSRQMLMTDDSPKAETSWRSRLRSRSQSRSIGQSRPKITDEADEGDEVDMKRHSASLPSREEVRILIGSSIHTDFYPVPPPPESAISPVSPNNTKHVSAPSIPGSALRKRSMSRSSTERLKAKSVNGMSEAVASEFARARSRDRMPSAYDRPRTVTPTRGSPKVSASTSSAQDVFPTWSSKPASPSTRSKNRNSLYAESIPPLPELPADVGMKAQKADEAVAKRFKSSPRASLLTTAHSSLISSANSSVEDHVITWPEAAKAAVESTALHPLQRSSRELSSASVPGSQDPSGTIEHTSDNAAAMVVTQSINSDTDEAASPTLSGWETQAKMWRQRRLSIGATLGKAVPDDDEKPSIIRQASVTSISKPKSPAIVVTRYITPLSKDNKSRQNVGRHKKDQASIHAESYIELIGKENRPHQEDVLRTGSAISSDASFVSTFDEPQPSPDPRTTIYGAASTPLTRTASGRVHTESGIWQAYNPEYASHAERSRALSLAKLTGELHDSTPKPSFYGLQQHPSLPSKSTDSLLDRYSGGLGYNWDRGAGFNGSAGTRVSGGEPTSRKNVPMSEAFGLDLSDVPVILRKVL